MSEQKRKKSYFSSHDHNQKKRKRFTMEAGMTGFLCTCNFREKDCVRDAYKLLNECADDLYGTKEDKNKATNENESNSQHDSEEEDISEALKKEICELQGESEKPISSRRFQVVDSGVKNVIFIKSNVPSPLEVVTKIVKDLNETKKQRTRFILRLLPIEVVCKAYMDDIKTKANILLEKYFSQEPKTFSIIFNRHSNNNIKREEVIEDLAGIITEKNPGNKADLKNPELAVVVEVIRGLCLLSVAPDYYKYKKYNLLEICNVKDNGEHQRQTEKVQDKNEEVDTTETICKETEANEEEANNMESTESSIP